MNKDGIVKAVAAKTGQTQKEVKVFLDALGDVFVESAELHEDVQWHGVLNITIEQREARTYNVPDRDGNLTPVEKAACHYVKLTPMKYLKEAVGEIEA